MSIMNTELYDAFKDAGASEEKARAAAVSVASYDARLSRIENRLDVLTWMVGFNLAMTLAVLFRAFS